MESLRHRKGLEHISDMSTYVFVWGPVFVNNEMTSVAVKTMRDMKKKIDKRFKVYIMQYTLTHDFSLIS